MSLAPEMLIRTKMFTDPSISLPEMKRIDEIKPMKEMVLTHNLNWGLVMTDHTVYHTGPLIKFNYQGGVPTMPIICHPEQRFAAPSQKAGNMWRWSSILDLEQGGEVLFIKALVDQERFFDVVRITEFEVVDVDSELLFTLTVANENSFIVHDLLTHRNLCTVPVSQEEVFK